MPVLVATIWAMEVDSSEMMVMTKTNKPKGRPTSSAGRKQTLVGATPTGLRQRR